MVCDPKIGLETSIGSLGYGYYNGKNTVEMPEGTRKTTEEGFSGGLSLSYNFNPHTVFILANKYSYPCFQRLRFRSLFAYHPIIG